MMAWDPNDRFASVGDAVRAVEELQRRLEDQVTLKPARPARKARPGTRRQRTTRPRRRRRR
jgi:hypothetical protein